VDDLSPTLRRGTLPGHPPRARAWRAHGERRTGCWATR